MQRASRIHSTPYFFTQSLLLRLITYLQMVEYQCRFAFCFNSPLFKSHWHGERQEMLESLECHLFSYCLGNLVI
ncbi:hypothetical protein Lalb_Chr18g0052431 [Lupinus albus]|uniref:Uncharacterized protein n=1 Tax=Lupinus albus TaxID=3870 RepID=A0A6A4P5E9_LUPAL|nr:hypothetical protein Lalb_Chr18g0052431 [Lupinus albus]